MSFFDVDGTLPDFMYKILVYFFCAIDITTKMIRPNFLKSQKCFTLRRFRLTIDIIKKIMRKLSQTHNKMEIFPVKFLRYKVR